MKRAGAIVFVAVVAALLSCCVADAADWHQQRGPEQNGISRERNLPERWDPSGENLLWSNKIGGISTPIVMKGRVYVMSRAGDMQPDWTSVAGMVRGLPAATSRTQESLVCVDGETGKPMWEYRQTPAGSPVRYEDLGASGATGDPQTGRVYAVFADGTLVCLDGADGRLIWKRQLAEELGVILTRVPLPAPLLDEDRVLVNATAAQHATKNQPQSAVFAFDKGGGQLFSINVVANRPGRAEAQIRPGDIISSMPWGGGTAAFAGGRIYIQTAAGMFCIVAKDARSSDDPTTHPTTQAAQASGPAEMAQLLPPDLPVKAGEKALIRVDLFDAAGHPASLPTTRPVPPEFTLHALAPIQPITTRPTTAPTTLPSADELLGTTTDATFTAGDGSVRAGEIIGQIAEFQARAFVRITPPLPWKLDFQQEQLDHTPAIFVGAPLKVQDENGNRVLANAEPLATCSYFGRPDMCDYTIQADVKMGRAGADGKLGEAGVINSRYTLAVVDNGRRLRIHVWPGALPYGLTQSVDYSWEPQRWYTLKLQVEQAPEKATVRGKAWPAGQREPSEWMIELEDTNQNRSGSPGLYGVGRAGTVLYDNIVVTEAGK